MEINLCFSSVILLIFPSNIIQLMNPLENVNKTNEVFPVQMMVKIYCHLIWVGENIMEKNILQCFNGGQNLYAT